MKKVNILICIIVVTIYANCATAQENKMALVRGNISTIKMPEEISLYSISDGESVFHTKTKVDKAGNFGFYFIPEYNGFYIIGDKKNATRLYLHNGSNLELKITDNGFHILSSDKENRVMEAWNKIIKKLKEANTIGTRLTYKEVFPMLPEFEKEKNNFLLNHKTGNLNFDHLFTNMVKEEFNYEVTHFLYMPRTAHPKFEDYPSIYSKIVNTPMFENAKILQYEFGQNWINMFMNLAINFKNHMGSQLDEDQIDRLALNNLKNDTLKGWYFLNTRLIKGKHYDDIYLEAKDKFGKYILTESQKEKLAVHERETRILGKGVDGVNFTGQQPNGKKASLKDYVGKLVYVDVWATWCGPCRKEIPYLKQVEEEMKDDNIVFISYSIDEKKDIGKWIKYIEEQKLPGIQLLGEDAFKSAICADYKITGIPRFMLFDKDGKIISSDAPRPSDPKLKTLIKSHIK